jgi:hypothetical protein
MDKSFQGSSHIFQLDVKEIAAEAERIEIAEVRERERLAAAVIEEARLLAEQIAAAEVIRVEEARLMAEMIAANEVIRIAQEAHAELVRLEQIKAAEIARLAKEAAEALRLREEAVAAAEAYRLEQIAKAKKAENMRLEREAAIKLESIRLEHERLENERIAAEALKQEQEALAAEVVRLLVADVIRLEEEEAIRRLEQEAIVAERLRVEEEGIFNGNNPIARSPNKSGKSSMFSKNGKISLKDSVKQAVDAANESKGEGQGGATVGTAKIGNVTESVMKAGEKFRGKNSKKGCTTM